MLLGYKPYYNTQKYQLQKFDLQSGKHTILPLVFDIILNIEDTGSNIVILELDKQAKCLRKTILNYDLEISGTFQVPFNADMVSYYKKHYMFGKVFYHFNPNMLVSEDFKIVLNNFSNRTIANIDTEIRNNTFYFSEFLGNERRFSKIEFSRNTQLNPYLLILILAELLILSIDLLFSQQIAIPISSPNKNYFCLGLESHI